MDYTVKLAYQSNYWYNDGLAKAQVRDMSGAITSLKKSLQYNRSNLAARNLLGLVYYGRGDVIEALVEWILSKNFQPKDNIASYFISKVQETPGELEEINQAVKRYNQSLEYARQGGEDLAIIQLKKAVAAHPTYVKAYQLLALLYIKTEQYASARQILRKVHRLDATDEKTIRYMHELTEIRKERPISVKESEKNPQKTVKYQLGNETIIQPVAAGVKERASLHTVANIAIGVLVGVAVMWFLIMPAINSSEKKSLNKQTVSFSDQIAEQKSQISTLKTELETYRANSEETENAQSTAASTQDSYEVVMNIAEHYKTEDMSKAAMAEELVKVNTDSLGAVGKAKFEELTGKIYPDACKKQYRAAKEAYEEGNYDTVVSDLETVMQMDESYSDGAAMLLLAQGYEKKGDQDKANEKYQKIIETWPNTDVATTAQQALDAQSGNTDNSDSKKTDDSNKKSDDKDNSDNGDDNN